MCTRPNAPDRPRSHPQTPKEPARAPTSSPFITTPPRPAAMHERGRHRHTTAHEHSPTGGAAQWRSAQPDPKPPRAPKGPARAPSFPLFFFPAATRRRQTAAPRHRKAQLSGDRMCTRSRAPDRPRSHPPARQLEGKPFPSSPFSVTILGRLNLVKSGRKSSFAEAGPFVPTSISCLFRGLYQAFFLRHVGRFGNLL